MTDARSPSGLPGGLSCDEVRDLAASFVLDALPEAETAAIREHLATCAEPHPEIAELGAVVPVLQASVPLMDPPAALKDRLMAAAAADLEERRRSETAAQGPAAATQPPAAAVPTSTPTAPVQAAEPVPIDRVRQSRLSWVLGIAAVLVIVLLGASNLRLRSDLDAAQAYQQQVASVLDAARQPGALTAVMTTTSGEGPNGIAAVTTDGQMRIAMRDLEPTAGTEVYEAWVILPDTAPAPLGSFQVGGSGSGYLEAPGLPTTPGMVLALTREPGPGATAPSSDPVSVGTTTASG